MLFAAMHESLAGPKPNNEAPIVTSAVGGKPDTGLVSPRLPFVTQSGSRRPHGML